MEPHFIFPVDFGAMLFGMPLQKQDLEIFVKQE
jgi:hypothetical protein